MALRTIVTKPDEVLHKKYKEVPAANERIRQILNNMAQTIYRQPNGAGPAACQAGLFKRLAGTDMVRKLIKPVSPQMAEQNSEQGCIKGCLRFPGRFGKTKCPQKAVAQIKNKMGKAICTAGASPVAKRLCHKLDQLGGIAMLNRAYQWL